MGLPLRFVTRCCHSSEEKRQTRLDPGLRSNCIEPAGRIHQTRYASSTCNTTGASRPVSTATTNFNDLSERTCLEASAAKSCRGVPCARHAPNPWSKSIVIFRSSPRTNCKLRSWGSWALSRMSIRASGNSSCITARRIPSSANVWNTVHPKEPLLETCAVNMFRSLGFPPGTRRKTSEKSRKLSGVRR